MRNSQLSLNEEINIYIHSGLTPDELFIIRLLFLAIDGDSKPITNYLSNVSNGKALFKSVLQSLKDKKVILSSFQIPKEGETLKFKNIPFNKNFIKMYVRESNDLGKELFDAYPPFINIRGKLCSIRNFTRANIYTFEDFCLYYSKTIKSCGITHEKVMDLLEFGKENNFINYSILEFISSRKWEELEYIQNSGDINGFQNSELI